MLHTVLRLFSAIGDACDPAANGAFRFLGLPYWYEYLPGERDALGKCVPTIAWGDLISLWAIGLAIADILLRIVALVAVGYIIYGGFQYMTSAGSPDATKSAKDTIVNGLIGAVIAVFAVAIVSFIGNRLG